MANALGSLIGDQIPKSEKELRQEEEAYYENQRGTVRMLVLGELRKRTFQTRLTAQEEAQGYVESEKEGYHVLSAREIVKESRTRGISEAELLEALINSVDKSCFRDYREQSIPKEEAKRDGTTTN